MESNVRPDITQEIFEKWQHKIDLMAQVIDVPVGLIMKVHPEEIEVFVSSKSEGNPYEKGAREELNIGLYCETVMASRKMLNVPDALADEDWDDNPDIKLGMISYLGLPLEYPNGDLFGTVCILDQKERHFTDLQKDVLNHFKDSLESDLQLESKTICQKKIQKELDEIQSGQKQLK
ncbi:MAG: GAF domain-containing protein [Marinifilaceae bacterium]|jgi:GAF domain-containing protein